MAHRFALRTIVSVTASTLLAAAVAAGGAVPVRVAGHRAAMTLDPPSRVYVCADTMRIVRPPGADSVFLRLHPAYTVSEFAVGGSGSRFVFAGGKLSWEWGSSDSAAEVTIGFRGRIDFPSEFTRVGERRAVLRAEETLPWGDGPIDAGRIAVTVPSEWSVAGAGSIPETGPESGTATGSGSRTGTHILAWDRPLRSVGWICAGEYRSFLLDASGSRPAITLFRMASVGSPAVDSTGPGAGNAALLSLCDSLLRFYGSVFTPYPFDRLSIVETDDWLGGPSVLAVAAPALIMVKRTAFLTDDPFNAAATILPHEVAHQWWSWSVYPGERDGALLSEGLCEYSSILYGEASGRKGPRDSLPASPLLRPLIAKVRRGAAIPLDTAVDMRLAMTQYLKSAYVHHMLRGLIGAAPYLRTLGELARRYAGLTVTTSDFARLASEASGKNLDAFFAQWVSGSGLPSVRVYNARSEPAPGGWKVTGRVRIVGYEKFSAEVPVEIRTAGSPSRIVVSTGFDAEGRFRNDVPFEVTTVAEPAVAAADPDGDLLLLRRLPEKLSDLRDAADALLVVGSGPLGPVYRSLASADSSRLAAAGWNLRIVSDAAVTLRDLQRERVVLYGSPDDNALLGRSPASFPYAASGGALRIGGETVRDSSLGLIQAVENPWLAEGLLIWVQPFGPGARPELRPYDHSWVIVRGHDVIQSGTWEREDTEMRTPVRPSRSGGG